jgi:hypothetical protein
MGRYTMTRFFFQANILGVMVAEDIGEMFPTLRDAEAHAAIVASELSRNGPSPPLGEHVAGRPSDVCGASFFFDVGSAVSTARVVCSVTDLSTSHGFECPRCKTIMDEVVRIAPLVSEPGLIGYECPACCYVTSVILPPKGP